MPTAAVFGSTARTLTWHTDYGGGLWWAPWNLTNAIRIYGAKSDEQTTLYVLLGFGF